MPPRIEKWVMEMQDVVYELVYEPGKDEADPLDYLSRHPLPETEDDKTKKIIRWTVNAKACCSHPANQRANSQR